MSSTTCDADELFSAQGTTGVKDSVTVMNSDRLNPLQTLCPISTVDEPSSEVSELKIEPLQESTSMISSTVTSIKQEAPEASVGREKTFSPIVLDSDDEDDIATATGCEEPPTTSSTTSSCATTSVVPESPVFKAADVNGNIFQPVSISSPPQPQSHEQPVSAIVNSGHSSSIVSPATTAILNTASSPVASQAATCSSQAASSSLSSQVQINENFIPEAAQIMLSLAQETLLPTSSAPLAANATNTPMPAKSNTYIQVPQIPSTSKLGTSVANITCRKNSTGASAPMKLQPVSKTSLASVSRGKLGCPASSTQCVSAAGTTQMSSAACASSMVTVPCSSESRDELKISPPAESQVVSNAITAAKTSIISTTSGSSSKPSYSIKKSPFVNKYFASSSGGRYGQTNKSKNGAPTFPSRNVTFPNLSAFAAKATLQRNNRNSNVAASVPKNPNTKAKGNGGHSVDVLSGPDGSLTMKILTNVSTSLPQLTNIDSLPTIGPNRTVTTVKNLSDLIATSVGNTNIIMKAIPVLPVVTTDTKSGSRSLKPIPAAISVPLMPCSSSGTKAGAQITLVDANILGSLPSKPQSTTSNSAVQAPQQNFSSAAIIKSVASSLATSSQGASNIPVMAVASTVLTPTAQTKDTALHLPSTSGTQLSLPPSTSAAVSNIQQSSAPPAYTFTTLDLDAIRTPTSCNTAISNISNTSSSMQMPEPGTLDGNSTVETTCKTNHTQPVSKVSGQQENSSPIGPIPAKVNVRKQHSRVIENQISETGDNPKENHKAVGRKSQGKELATKRISVGNCGSIPVISTPLVIGAEKKIPPHIPVQTIPTVHSQQLRNRPILPKSPTAVARPQENLHALTSRLPLQGSKATELLAASASSEPTASSASSIMSTGSTSSAVVGSKKSDTITSVAKSQQLVTPVTSISVTSSTSSYDPDVTPIKKLKLMCNGIDTDVDSQKEKEQENFLKTFATNSSPPIVTKVKVTNGDGHESKYMHRKHHIMSQHRNAQKAQNGCSPPSLNHTPMSPNPLANGYDEPLELTTKPVQERQKEKSGEQAPSTAYIASP